jgi:hypothetical protein
MSIVVEMREYRICPSPSFGLAPASTIQVACEVRRQRQLIQGRLSLHAAGLICRVRMLLSRIGTGHERLEHEILWSIGLHSLVVPDRYDHTYPEKLVSQFHIAADTARHLAKKFSTAAHEGLEPARQNPRLLSAVVSVPLYHDRGFVLHSIRDGNFN